MSSKWTTFRNANSSSILHWLRLLSAKTWLVVIAVAAAWFTFFLSFFFFLHNLFCIPDLRWFMALTRVRTHTHTYCWAKKVLGKTFFNCEIEASAEVRWIKWKKNPSQDQKVRDKAKMISRKLLQTFFFPRTFLAYFFLSFSLFETKWPAEKQTSKFSHLLLNKSCKKIYVFTIFHSKII